jgi:thiamine pyrophosphokinase
MDTALIFAGGDPPEAGVIDDLPTPDLVVAADGGYDHANRLGIGIDVLVGDMDSIAAAEIPQHVLVEKHAPDKDATDLELAMTLVLGDSPSRVVVVGGGGGRFDHELATTEMLCSDRWASIEEIDWVSTRGTAHVVRGHRQLHGDPGGTLSLVPVGGDARGVTTKGLRWNLENEILTAGTTRGVSNLLTGPIVDVTVGEGCLLAMMPASRTTP